MKNSMSFIFRICALCFALGITGNLSAHPTHKHPKKNRYYYYPRQNVYYDPVESVYFVWEKSYWKPVSYPSGRYVSVTYSNSPRFEFWVASDHPYYYNVEHRRTYHEYRVVRPAPVARARVVSRPKPNVSFEVSIHSGYVHPEPVYVEERVIVVKDRHHGHHPHHRPHPGRGHGHHKHGHPGRGHGRH